MTCRSSSAALPARRRQLGELRHRVAQRLWALQLMPEGLSQGPGKVELGAQELQSCQESAQPASFAKKGCLFWQEAKERRAP